MHVALLTQNCDLEIDTRPCAEGAALAAEGHRVTLVGRTSQPAEVRAVTDPSVHLALFRSPPEAEGIVGQALEMAWVFAASLRTLAKIARRHPIDVLHSSNPPDTAFLMAAALRPVQGYAPRFVFDQHDAGPELLEAKLNGRPTGRAAVALAATLERASFARADLTVFANDRYARRARERGLVRGASVVVPNGWRLPPAKPSDHWRRGARNLIVFVGEIAAQDHVDHLIEAAALLPSEVDFHLAIGGDGPARGEAAARADELGVASRVSWLGWMTDREEISSLVRSADVCVAPECDSAFNQISTFVKIVEYMSVGAPVVAHRLPATEDLAGESIEYAEDMTPRALADAILRVIHDPERARDLGARGLDRFQARVAWQATGAPRLATAYRALVAAPDTGSHG